MRFFKKLLGSLSNSDKKNDYARATSKFATSPGIIERNAIVIYNQGLPLKTEGRYRRQESDYHRAKRIKNGNTVSVMNIRAVDLHGRRITVTSFRYHTSEACLSVSRS